MRLCESRANVPLRRRPAYKQNLTELPFPACDPPNGSLLPTLTSSRATRAELPFFCFDNALRTRIRQIPLRRPSALAKTVLYESTVMDILPRGNTPPLEYLWYTQEAHNSTIHQAAAIDDLARVTEFLDAGVDVNSRDRERKTALYRAVCNDSSTMVRLLLSHGADTSLRDDWDPDWPDGFTPMENAARLNTKAALQELLAHGVEFERSHAVYFAASKNHAEVLKLLLENTEGSMSDSARQQAFAIALQGSAAQRSCELVQWLLEMAGYERALDDHWQGALNCAFLAVGEGLANWPELIHSKECDEAIQVLEILIEAGASITAHSNGCSPLHLALHLDSPSKLVAFLLAHGVDPNFCAPGEHSPFFQLLESPTATEELVKMFTDAGAVLGPPDARGRTILHCVRKPSIAAWLLKLGADISAIDDEGELPLHKACLGNNFDLVSLFLDAGSPVDQRNNLGWTPFIQSGSVDISKSLLDRGADIHAASGQGITAIHHAAKACDSDVVSFLLANGADVHALARREDHRSDTVVAHNTPLHLAVTSALGAMTGGTLQVVTGLLDHGADIEAKEGTGKTALLLAISQDFGHPNSRRSNEQVVNYLLESGANLHAVDTTGKNAVQLAGERHYMFGETGKFERKPLPPLSARHLDVGPGRGRGRRGFGRGSSHA
jgi:ankyrin repeat protein